MSRSSLIAKRIFGYLRVVFAFGDFDEKFASQAPRTRCGACQQRSHPVRGRLSPLLHPRTRGTSPRPRRRTPRNV